jgi:hypothetical protein
MTVRQGIYVGLAVLGLIVPWAFNIQFFFGDDPGNLVDFFADGFTTDATSSLTVDLLIAWLAAAVFVFAETRRAGMRRAWFWIFLAVSGSVAFACALPLFLLARERHLAATELAPASA